MSLSPVTAHIQHVSSSGGHGVSLLLQVDKLEQSDTMRSEEEQRAEEKPIVLSKSFLLVVDSNNHLSWSTSPVYCSHSSLSESFFIKTSWF